MFVLIALVSNTMLGTYPTEKRCMDATRAIYERRIDPMQVMQPKVKGQLLDIYMKYTAPREYLCIKK